MATAGSIIDEDTTEQKPAANITTATESICPKGWTLPSKIQIDNQKNITSFLPVLGGIYSDSVLYGNDTHGYWWTNEAANGSERYRLTYDISKLYTGYSPRIYGTYIRCVSEEKTVLDLTYMQDMTPAIP